MSSQYDPIPPHLMQEMQSYVRTGCVHSDFLRAIIDNDLKAAVSHADESNQNMIYLYVLWFYNRAPALCWGSPLNRQAWASIAKRIDHTGCVPL
jgi:hypothetical protein